MHRQASFTSCVSATARTINLSGSDDQKERWLKPNNRHLLPPCSPRLTRPGAGRMLEQLVAILIKAIIPQPMLARLRRCHAMLARNIYEQPRQRCYKKVKPAF
jgi:hypothetical protein